MIILSILSQFIKFIGSLIKSIIITFDISKVIILALLSAYLVIFTLFNLTNSSFDSNSIIPSILILIFFGSIIFTVIYKFFQFLNITLKVLDKAEDYIFKFSNYLLFKSDQLNYYIRKKYNKLITFNIVKFRNSLYYLLLNIIVPNAFVYMWYYKKWNDDSYMNPGVDSYQLLDYITIAILLAIVTIITYNVSMQMKKDMNREVLE